jgi:hypothetical protein
VERTEPGKDFIKPENQAFNDGSTGKSIESEP